MEKIAPKMNMAYDGAIGYICRSCSKDLEFNYVDDFLFGFDGSTLIATSECCGIIYEVHVAKTFIRLSREGDRASFHPKDTSAHPGKSCPDCECETKGSGEREETANGCSSCWEDDYEIDDGEDVCDECLNYTEDIDYDDEE